MANVGKSRSNVNRKLPVFLLASEVFSTQVTTWNHIDLTWNLKSVMPGEDAFQGSSPPGSVNDL